MRIIPYLMLLIFVSFMFISPVSADEYIHEVYQSTGSPYFHKGSTGNNANAVANQLTIMDAALVPSVHYIILESTVRMVGVEGAQSISFTNGLTGTVYLSHTRNVLGDITGSRALIFFDNWEEKVPSTGMYVLTIANYASNNYFYSNANMYKGYSPGIPSGKAVCVVGGTHDYYGRHYSPYISAKINSYVYGKHTITLDYTADTVLLQGDLSSSEINDATRYVYLSTTPDEQTSSIFYRESPLHGTSWTLIIPSPTDTYYLSSELGGVFKQWIINIDKGETPPDEPTGSYTLHKINTPPHVVGSEINYQLYVDSILQNVTYRVEFTTTKEGLLYSSRTYIKEGEVFKVNGLGSYTFDELLYYFTPDAPTTYNTGVTVYTDTGLQLFTDSRIDTVSVSPTTAILRAEVTSAYDGSYISGVNAVISWGGVERYNDTLMNGVYETNIPKNSIITAALSHDDYHPRTVTATFDLDYNRWSIVLEPLTIPIGEGDCLAEFTVTDGTKVLPNARILFDGVIKYTNQLGYASYVTSDIGLKTYQVTLAGYQGASGNIQTIANTTVSRTVVLTPLTPSTPIETEIPITPTPIPTYPAVGEEGWGMVSAIKWLIATFLGIEDELWVNSILALCIIITSSIVIANITNDGFGAMVGAGIGFFIALVIGLIPIWIVFIMLALGGFTAFIMLQKGG